MKILLLINDKEIELNDKDVQFSEGEQVSVDGNFYRVQSVQKSILTEGKSADLAYRIIIK